MIWQWYAFFAALALCAGLTVIIRPDPLGDLLPFFSCVGFAIVALVFLVAGSAISLGRHYGRVSCRTFAAQTHRQTRFVIYTSWSSGDCLTSDGHGHWIPTKNLREFGSTS